MKEFFDFLVNYPLWVKLAVVALGATVVVLLIVFRPTAAEVAEQAPGIRVLPKFADVINTDIASAKDVTIIANWLPQWVLNASLENAISNGADVKMVFMKKDSRFLEQRSLDLGHTKDYGATRLANRSRTLHRLS